jgi:actin-related protein
MFGNKALRSYSHKSSMMVLHELYDSTSGLISDWDRMEFCWHQIFYDHLRAAPGNHPLIVTDHAWNTRANRERMIQIMFETFCVPSIYLANRSVCSLYSNGRTSGMVVSSGHLGTSVVPVINGIALTSRSHDGDTSKSVMQRNDIGGDINQ